ncbi:hypothetical protein [Pyxidicoccus caerfyrddinensis]|uniref:hypothetical protein n=1 Tax=Pyxidicoccus caerfyrddinensis TaxID=2709663 RepID=UPI0013DCE663|nr:hypothetical protein [Pyxidicoccus caerfyrddinensis]
MTVPAVTLGQVREGKTAKPFPPRVERVSIAGEGNGTFRVLRPGHAPAWLKPGTIARRWPVVVKGGATAKAPAVRYELDPSAKTKQQRTGKTGGK